MESFRQEIRLKDSASSFLMTNMFFFWTYCISMDRRLHFLQIGGVSHQSAHSVQEMGKSELVHAAVWLCRSVTFFKSVLLTNFFQKVLN